MVDIYSKRGRNDVLLVFVCRSLEKNRNPDITPWRFTKIKQNRANYNLQAFDKHRLCLGNGCFSTGREGSSLQGRPHYWGRRGREG